MFVVALDVYHELAGPHKRTLGHQCAQTHTLTHTHTHTCNHTLYICRIGIGNLAPGQRKQHATGTSTKIAFDAPAQRHVSTTTQNPWSSGRDSCPLASEAGSPSSSSPLSTASFCCSLIVNFPSHKKTHIQP